MNIRCITGKCITSITYQAIESKHVVSGYMGYDSGYERNIIAKGSFDDVKHFKNNKNIRIEAVIEKKDIIGKNYLKNMDFNEPIYSFYIFEKIPDLSDGLNDFFYSCVSCGISYFSDIDKFTDKYKNNSKYKITISPWIVNEYMDNISEAFLGSNEFIFFAADKNEIKKYVYKPYKCIENEIYEIIKLCSNKRRISNNKVYEFERFFTKVSEIIKGCCKPKSNKANYKKYTYTINGGEYTGPLSYEVFRDAIIKGIPEEYRKNRRKFKGYYDFKGLEIPIGKYVWCPNDMEIKKAFDNLIEYIEEGTFVLGTIDGYLTKLNTDNLKEFIFYRLYNEKVRNYIDSQKESIYIRLAEDHVEELKLYFVIPSISIVSNQKYVDREICIFDFDLFQLKLSQIIKNEPQFEFIKTDIIQLLSKKFNTLDNQRIENICKLVSRYDFSEQLEKYSTIDRCELDDIKKFMKEIYGYNLYGLGEESYSWQGNFINGPLYSLEGIMGINYLEEKNRIHGALKELK